MKVILRLGGSLSSTGQGEREVVLPPGASIGSFLESAGLKAPGGTPESRDDSRSRHGALTFLLNGRNIEFLECLDTPLADGDVIALFLASEGG
jgi:molybdopterin converting factor small subunit